MNCLCQTCETAPFSSLRGWVSSLLSPEPALDFLHLHMFCWRPHSARSPKLPGAQPTSPPSLHFCSQARTLFGVGAAESLLFLGQGTLQTHGGGFGAFQLSRFWALTLDPLQRVMLLLPYKSTTDCLPERKKILSSPLLWAWKPPKRHFSPLNPPAP